MHSSPPSCIILTTSYKNGQTKHSAADVPNSLKDGVAIRTHIRDKRRSSGARQLVGVSACITYKRRIYDKRSITYVDKKMVKEAVVVDNRIVYINKWS